MWGGSETDCLPFLTGGDDDGVGVGGFGADVIDPRMPFGSDLGSVKVVLPSEGRVRNDVGRVRNDVEGAGMMWEGNGVEEGA